MPRKSTKKDTSAESKAETGTTRRSGRSVTKQESPAAGKEASRSRRGSTAAATAASAADTKSPKGRTSTTRRDSTSPSEGRSHKKRKESEEPSRKTARRAASRVNYKESDGEEEGQAPKFDDAFDSNDEVDDSESDEKSKPKAGRGRAAKTPAKGRGSKGKGRKSRSSKGRSKKESSDEEDEDEPPIELSEDSVEVDEESTGKQAKESTRSSRGKKPKTDDSGAKPKSRRSGRAGTKEESPRKRPTRGVQAKKYTEDDDDEIEEIDDDKEEEKIEGGRKRKRSSESEPNKRLKDDDDAEEEKDDDGVEKDEKSSDTKDEPEKDEEPMEVDDEKKDETSAKKLDKESDDSAQKGDEAPEAGSTEKESSPEKKEDVEDLEEDMHDSNEDDSEDAEEAKIDEKDVEETKAEKSKTEVEDTLDSSNSIEEIEKSSESKTVSETVSNDPRSTQDSTETNAEKRSTESFQNDISPDSRSGNDSEKQPLPVSNESNSEVSVNGSEKPLSNTAPVIQTTNSVKLHDEEPVPTENGAHDLHNNSVSESDQYYPFPGRKYVVNTKLGESIRQSVKEKSFGFVSYNLGLSSSDSSIPKEKLLNELNKLDAHIICIQQVSKQFYCSILEPSLDALGFKGTFSSPGETVKGVATFYKSSLFRLSGQSEASLKHLIEKELETPTLDTNDRMVVKTHVKQCGHVLFTHFATVIGIHSLTVANVQIPPSDLSVHALQVSCLAKEVARVNGGNNKPFLLGGEFNMLENEAPYQLLKDGYLSNDMIEELQRRKDIALPGKESDALVNILWKSYQHPSSTLCSCYKSVLDHEVFIPEQKGTSPDLLWYSSDSLFTIGVLDASETAGDRHFSLKADIAFSM